jgi:hypothetical protein
MMIYFIFGYIVERRPEELQASLATSRFHQC